MRRGAWMTVLALLGLPVWAARAAETATREVAPVVVVGVTPIGGLQDIDRIPAPVQTATAADLERSRALDLTAFMTRELAGVYVNDIQNNPLQPDLNYRGYTASPLLGTPQGLSVYVDGVRLNQPFGDVVSWDLIPRQAIASIALMAGSNPLFGLNTLGGALSVQTKDGRGAPGASLQLSHGSYDRRMAEAEIGGEAKSGLHWYVTANAFEDDGWRDASPSNATQAFAKLGWRGPATTVALSGAFARTDLTGNALQDQRFLAQDRSSIYTKPDITQNRSILVNLVADQQLGANVSVSGNAYYRRIKTDTLNGDLNDETLTASVYQPNAAEQAALRAAGITGVPTAGETAANTPFPRFRCLANALLNAEPGETCNGLINTTRSHQREAGVSGQVTVDQPLAGRENQFTLGAAYKESRVDFIQATQYGYLTPDRGILGVGVFADGTQDSDSVDDARVDLAGRTRTASLYLTDTLTLAPGVAFTLSGRYDSERVRNRDAIAPGGGPGSLDGHHHFGRFNPSAGITYAPRPGLTAYASLSQGGRSPSAIELGCADPENPCRLPNALAGDPPLKAVRTLTGELGARGTIAGVAWNAGVFRAENHDDILFVADDVSGFGYFRNFGQTRRQGLEFGAKRRLGPVTLGANYTYLKATYRSAETVGGRGNSQNESGPGFEGEIEIEPGDRIPLIPQHLFKAQASWVVTDEFSLDADVIAVGGAYARGNENNEHQPDGVFYLGPGKTDGYAVFNLGADYRPTTSLRLFVQLNNVFDARYETAAQLGATGFTEAGAFIARPFAGRIVDGERPVRNVTFFAPGAPRMVWVGVRYRFD